MSAFPRPISIRCAVCDGPVHRCYVMKDPATLDTKFMVECHGDTETCSLSYDDLCDGVKVVEAVAFTTKRLAA